MMSEPLRALADLEIACPMDRERSLLDGEAAGFEQQQISPARYGDGSSHASLDHYIRIKQQRPEVRDNEDISIQIPANLVCKPGPNNNDDTLTTCNTSMSTFHSAASGSTITTIHGPLHQDDALKLSGQLVRRHSPLPTHPDAPPPRSVRKRVRFVLDDAGGARCTYRPPDPPMTEEEKQAVWWQPVEFKLFRRYCKKAAQIARQSDYAEQFTKVYDACSQKHITDVREHCHISRTHARGLEVVVFPTLVQARKLVIKGVVKTQEKLPPTMDAEQRAKVLSATSRCLTGRARLLSRVFAVGDEEVAKDCYYSMKG